MPTTFWVLYLGSSTLGPLPLPWVLYLYLGPPTLDIVLTNGKPGAFHAASRHVLHTAHPAFISWELVPLAVRHAPAMQRILASSPEEEDTS